MGKYQQNVVARVQRHQNRDHTKCRTMSFSFSQKDHWWKGVRIRDDFTEKFQHGDQMEGSGRTGRMGMLNN